MDGRGYHDPVFRQQLADYSASAVDARSGHSDASEILPHPPVMALLPGGNGHGDPAEPDPATD